MVVSIVLSLIWGMWGSLELLNVPLPGTKAFDKRIEDFALRCRFRKLCGVIKLLFAVMVFCMALVEKYLVKTCGLLAIQDFVLMYVVFGALLVGGQLWINWRHLGHIR